MQQQIEKGPSGKTRWLRPVASRPVMTMGIAALLVALVGGSIWLVYLNMQPQVIATNGAGRWATDTNTTPATIPFTMPETVQIAVDPAFTSYYQARNGAALLGAPVTPGFPVAQGWMQIFTSNALLLPGKHGPAATSQGQTNQQLAGLIQDGVKESRTGIIELPLLQTLLTVGSQASIGGGLTYIDVRHATNPDQMRPAPTTASQPNQNTTRPAASQGAFIQTGTSGGRQLGHLIPPAIWAFITRRDVSPDSWQTDFGAPLTEALPLASVQFGVSHRLLVQAFQRRAVVMDRDVKDAAGQPLIQPLDTGVAYLQTIAPPAPAFSRPVPIWTSSDLDILAAPAIGKAILHVGAHFPLTLAGKSRWNAGALWYRVQWKTPTSSGAGWIPASKMTFSAPAAPSDASTPVSGTSAAIPSESSAWSAFDKLSPGLAQYLAGQGERSAAVVYDLTRQKYYAYHLDNQYLMGNAVKLPMLLAYLAMTEQQGHEPDASEIDQLTAMMSGGADGASEQVYNELGRAPGLKQYLNQLGVTGLEPENDDVLYSMAKPLAMAQLLALLYEGKILTARDRGLAFSLLHNTPPEQQVGVGDTSPPGAAATVQDGWVMGTDNRWAMNSSGIVTAGSETYLIAVFSAHLNSLAEGKEIARQVCIGVASLLA